MRGRKGSAVLSAALSAALAVSLCPALALADEPAAEGAQQPAAEQPAAEPVEEGEAAAAAEPAVAAEPQTQSAEPAAVPATTLAASYDWYGDGAVTEYAIATAAELLGFANIVNGTDGKTADSFAGKTIKLSAHIDLSGISWTPIGVKGKPFSGTFDGGNHLISNVNVGSCGDYAGLFGYVMSSGKNAAAVIRNLGVDGVTVSYKNYTASAGYVYAGALTGYAGRAFIKNVSVKGANVSAQGMSDTVNLAGLAGRAYCVIASDCSVENIGLAYSGSGVAYLGGMAGRVTGHSVSWTAEDASPNSLFERCAVSGAVISSNQDSTAGKTVYTGGFVAGCDSYNYSHNTYKGCKANGIEITCMGDGKHIAGGFMAVNTGMGEDSSCEAAGAITYSGSDSSSVFGGFIGQQGGRGRVHSGHVADVDIVANGAVGGFIGKTVQYLLEKDHANHYVFKDCIANGDVKGNTVGGFAGEVGCYGGDGHQIWVDFTNCIANGDVAGDKAAGFLGAIANKSADFTNPERSGVTLTDCVANGTVSGSSVAAGMIAEIVNRNPGKDVSTPVGLVNCVSSPVITGLSEDTRISIDCVMAAEEGLYDESVISIDVTQGVVVPPEEEKPLPPAGTDGTDGTDDGTNNDGSDVKPVSKSDGDSSKSLAKTGDSAGLALAGLGAAAVAAAGACAIARRRAE